MSTRDGYWQIPGQTNLCLRCGVRIWERDMGIHDSWHTATRELPIEATGTIDADGHPLYRLKPPIRF